MEYLVLFLLSLVVICAGQSRTVPEEWTADIFPDPAKEPGRCNRYGKPSYVCDPNKILEFKEADILDHLLEGVYNNDTKCPCSAYACRNPDFKIRNKGYYMTVAIVQRIKKKAGEGDTEEEKYNRAGAFAEELRNSSQRTKGFCDNDVLIVYSAEDEVVFTVPGSTSKLRLNNDVASEITKNHLGHFVDNVYAGLYSMIIDYRNVLKGDYVSWRERDLSQTVRGGASQPVFSFSIVLTLVLAAILS